MARRGSTRRRAASLGLAALMVGAIGIPPASAHFTQNPRHLGVHAWKQVIKQKVFTRKQANNRFLRSGQGLRLEPHAESPNVIGGHSGNEVTAGAHGAAIGGGGNLANSVTDNFGTVGGGEGNQAGNSDGDPTASRWATVGGGRNNTASGAGATVGGGIGNTANGHQATMGGGLDNSASGLRATVGGGLDNTASGARATVGGGDGNTASGARATVGGGDGNTASAQAATVGGGDGNTASGELATVGGGEDNTASAFDATVGGGLGNTASGSTATVGGGSANTASGTAATVPGGLRGAASRYGEMAHASGRFSANGDAQASEFVLRRVTTDASAGPLFLDGSGQRLTLADGQTLAFEGLVAARTSTAAGGESAGFRIQGVIKRVGATTSFVGTASVFPLARDDTSWNVELVADNTNNALAIQVTGASGKTIRWVATVRATQVAF